MFLSISLFFTYSFWSPVGVSSWFVYVLSFDANLYTWIMGSPLVIKVDFQLIPLGCLPPLKTIVPEKDNWNDQKLKGVGKVRTKLNFQRKNLNSYTILAAYTSWSSVCFDRM